MVNYGIILVINKNLKTVKGNFLGVYFNIKNQIQQ